MIGRQLGHFRVTGEIGAGGMGVVYQATDLRLHRTVALKVLPLEVSSDPERRGRLEREARAASALNHPNIVTVYEIDSAEGVDFIAMEHVEGRTLDALIGSSGLGLTEALSYATQIAGALAVAHAHGIVHRDVKPRNVMVTAQSQVKVLDFGLARRVQVQAADSEAPTVSAEPRTAAGTIAGTVAYMSPEQAEGKTVDARSDIFSFGVVLYEMLTGRRPFSGSSQAQVLSAILRDKPPTASSIHPELPEEMDRILEKALDKDVECRYQHIEDLSADLRRLRRSAVGLDPSPVAALAGRKRLMKLTAIAAAVVLVGAFVWSLRSRRATPTPGTFRLLSTFPGSHRAPSLSPDGRMLAFIDTSREAQVWVKYLEEGDPIQITTGDVPVGRPRWSPKGDQILFERQRQGIWSVPPLGGPPRRILEQGSCPAFFPDGERLVFDRGEELWTARVDGSQAGPIAGVPVNYFSATSQRCAAVSPDGRFVAYYQPERGPFGDFWVIPASGGTPRRLTSDSAEGGGLVWTPDGRFVIVSSSRGGGRTLWLVPLGGGTPQPLTSGAGSDVDPEVSRDGGRLVYANARHSHALMLLDAATGEQRILFERRRMINGASFSPDGTRIAFFMNTDELEHLFTIGVEGTDLLQVTKGGRSGNIMPHWSTDGSALYFYQDLGRTAFRKVPATGGPAATVIDGWTWPIQNGARADPQDRRLAYTLFEEGRIKATLVRELGTGRETPLKRNIYPAEWSPDGQSLVGADWSRDDGSQMDFAREDAPLLICPADAGACRAVGEGRFAVWSADGSRLYFERNRRVLDTPTLCSVEAWVMRPDGSEARRIATLGPQPVLTTEIAVSVKDQIAWVQFRRGQEELWLADLTRGF